MFAPGAQDIMCTDTAATDADSPAQTVTYSIAGGADAGRFGFRNLPSEPWHWSTNGR